MAGARRSRPVRGPGDRLVAAGAAVFVAGLVAVVAVFVPFLFGTNERGVALSLATFLTSAGMGLALLGLLGSSRARRRRYRPGSRSDSNPDPDSDPSPNPDTEPDDLCAPGVG